MQKGTRPPGYLTLAPRFHSRYDHSNVSTISEPASAANKIARMAHMRHLVDQLHQLEDRLRLGGGPAKIERQHRAGKMAARERIAALLPGTPFLEIGLLLAYDQYDGEAPCLGSVTGIGKIEGRYAVVIAGDATVKAGSWWPETVTKGLRAQEIAMRNRIPIPVTNAVHSWKGTLWLARQNASSREDRRTRPTPCLAAGRG
jgi:hypothetical protein